jgi:hypothetical protein
MRYLSSLFLLFMVSNAPAQVQQYTNFQLNNPVQSSNVSNVQRSNTRPQQQLNPQRQTPANTNKVSPQSSSTANQQATNTAPSAAAQTAQNPIVEENTNEVSTNEVSEVEPLLNNDIPQQEQIDHVADNNVGQNQSEETQEFNQEKIAENNAGSNAAENVQDQSNLEQDQTDVAEEVEIDLKLELPKANRETSELKSGGEKKSNVSARKKHRKKHGYRQEGKFRHKKNKSKKSCRGKSGMMNCYRF